MVAISETLVASSNPSSLRAGDFEGDFHMMCAVEITVGDDTSRGDGLQGTLHRESNDTLLRHTEQLTGNTWISNPQRAVLEVAQSGMYPRWDERLGWMIVNRFDVCTPAEVCAVADDLGYRAGLRRLSSLTQALTESKVGRSYDFDPDPIDTGGDRTAHPQPVFRCSTANSTACSTTVRPNRSTSTRRAAASDASARD